VGQVRQNEAIKLKQLFKLTENYRINQREILTNANTNKTYLIRWIIMTSSHIQDGGRSLL